MAVPTLRNFKLSCARLSLGRPEFCSSVKLAQTGVSYGRTFITPHAMRIATLAVGYADGFPRQVSGRDAHVLVGGKRCPILGRVTMDQILADVTSLPQINVGDEAVLIGQQGRVFSPEN